MTLQNTVIHIVVTLGTFVSSIAIQHKAIKCTFMKFRFMLTLLEIDNEFNFMFINDVTVKGGVGPDTFMTVPKITELQAS